MGTTNETRRVRDMFGLVGMITGVLALVVSLGVLPRPVADYIDTQKSRSYFENLAKRDARLAKRMMSRQALSGTAAADFAAFQYYYAEARDQGRNFEDPVQTVKLSRNAINLCRPGPRPTADEVCNRYDNFVMEGDHLASFDVNGEPIDDRLYVDRGKDPVKALGAELSILAAYQGISQLYLAVRIHAIAQPIIVHWEESQYQDSSGDLRPWTGVFLGRKGPVPPGATRYFIAAYAKAGLGGTLELPLSTNEGEVPKKEVLPVGGL
jgi:hypothetical protein